MTNTEFHIQTEGKNIQKFYDVFEQKLKYIMDQCFQRSSNNKQNKNNQHAIRKEHYGVYKQINMFARKGKAQRRVARCYIEALLKANTEKVAALQKERIKTALQNLTVNNTFSPNKFWDLCKKARQKHMLGISVETDDGHELFGEEMI